MTSPTTPCSASSAPALSLLLHLQPPFRGKTLNRSATQKRGTSLLAYEMFQPRLVIIILVRRRVKVIGIMLSVHCPIASTGLRSIAKRDSKRRN